MEEQKMMIIDMDKVYVNVPKERVLFFADKDKTKHLKTITLTQFRNIIKKTPTINYLISILTLQ